MFNKGDENMPTKNSRMFLSGCKDAMPIALGYLSVAFAFGILSVQHGLPVWSPILISLTNFTGTGQFVGADLLAAGATLVQIAITILIVNLRYLLMSLSMSQAIDEDMPVIKRFILSFGVTDEIFAVSMQQKKPLKFTYLMGLMLFSYFGWNLGTALGVFASSIIPPAVQSALGIAIYAMFVAIVIPPAKESKIVSCVIVIAVFLSCCFHYIPYISNIDEGWSIIISGVAAALIGAVIASKKKAGAENER